jgi:hypothetical protein
MQEKFGLNPEAAKPGFPSADRRPGEKDSTMRAEPPHPTY